MIKRKRPIQHNPPKGSPAHEARMERQRARRAVDKKANGTVTKLSNGKRVANRAKSRIGKDVSHNKALARGGSNKDGYKLESPSKNRARNSRRKK